MPADPQRIQAAFLAAIEAADPAGRAALLDRECGDDAEVRRRVEELLRAHDQPGSFLDHPAAPEATSDHVAPGRWLGQADTPPPSEGPGSRIGPYKLLQQVGEGGMGAVYMAEQEQPVRRKVALKIIKPGMDSGQVIARFEAERQALALMDHQNIARVLDAGTTASGRPYFVMELVKGVPITKFCDEQHLTPRERLELFVPVCQAIQHAHHKGIIHRDVKPSNVLVTLYDGKPVPKVIDFGVAKAIDQRLTERTLFTQLGQVVGTLEYMSPEQAELNQLDIDTRSDVYSLGVLLYELLTGSTPLEKQRLRSAAFTEMLRMIREEEPPKPSTRLNASGDTLPVIAARRKTEPARLAKLVRGELDWIVMKALEKDRGRRYETANAFALDVQHYLADEPVAACPPSAWYKLRKFARKNRKALATAGAFGLLLLVLLALGLGNALWRAQKQTAAETEARDALQEAVRWQQGERWSEALSAVRRAQGVLQGFGADAGLRQQISQLGKDLEMAEALEEARLRLTEIVDGHFDYNGCIVAHAAAFEAYGLELGHGDVGAAAEFIRSRSIRLQLVAALDFWARLLRHNEGQGWRHLLAVARAADGDAWRDRLRDAWARGDGQAMNDLLASAEVEKQSPATLKMLGVPLLKDVAGGQVAALLRRAQQRHPNDFWINLDLALLLHHARPPQLEEATRHYMIAVALRPQSPGAHVGLGHALADKGLLDEAITEFQEAIRLKQDFARAHNNLGYALQQKGRTDEAIEEYREAIRLDKDDVLAHTNLGNVWRSRGQLDGWIAEFREVVRLKKDDPVPHNNLGHALAMKGWLDEAIDEFHEAIRLKPDDAEAHSNLGVALIGKGRLDEAIDEFHEAIRLKKDYPEAHGNLGNALRLKGRLDEAIGECREAIRLKTDLPEAHDFLGGALAGKGRLDEAIDEFREAVRLKKDFAEAYRDLGTALQMKGQLDRAIEAYREAIRLNRDDAQAHHNLGLALKNKGQPDAAIDEFRAAIRIHKEDALAHCNLGLVLVQQGKFKEGVEELGRGHALGSRQPGWPHPSAEWLRDAEGLADLDARLPALLKGDQQPKDAAERLALAQFCQQPKQLFAAAARWYGEAFAREPQWANDLNAQHRYNAACAAALAGCGRGEDAAKLGDQERARLRGQALAWLRADLSLLAKRVAGRLPEGRAAAQKALRHWLEDTDFAAVRGAALAKLPETEQQAWRQLWADVTETLGRAQGQAAGQKKADPK
jgi:serine/threonine protein kinase/Flp pilus assembly protein TadD